MTRTDIQTFGCRLNTYESAVIRKHADAAGLDDAIIFNTCAVTAEATRQARQAIRRARRENPDAKIIVTGCAAQVDPAGFGKMPEIDLLVGNREKLQAETFKGIAAGKAPKEQISDIMTETETAGELVHGFDGRARAFIEVQNGCDHRCTFCIIPYGRGNARSTPIPVVVDQVKGLVAKGFNEVVLTGVDLTSYGPDLPGEESLGTLTEAIMREVPELPRLRISSIDAVEVDDTLFRLITEEERILPHLHLSLQAGSNMILKRMKRRHTREDAIDFCKRVKAARPDIVFGADIIAGFPTETEDMFQDSLDLVADCGLTYLHVFPYSPREGTPAAKMPQVDGNVRKERAARLRAAGEAAVKAHMKSRLGGTAQVLVERALDGTSTGHTEDFIPVTLMGVYEEGKVVEATLTEIGGAGMIGNVT